MPSLILSQQDILKLLDLKALMPIFTEGFIQQNSTAVSAQRVRLSLPVTGSSAMVLLPGLLTGIPAYSVKVNAKFPETQPAIKGLVQLFDLYTGELLALLDSGVLTAIRTGVAAALGTHSLALASASRVAIIGAGRQARWLLRSLATLRRIEEVFIYDTQPFVSGRFAADIARELAAKFIPVNTLTEALFETDIVLCATWARTPFLFEGMVIEGSHISSLGSDEPGKLELDASLLETSYLVVDHKDLSLQQGSLANAGLGKAAIDADLAEVLQGKAGRASNLDITIFSSIGLPWQDLALAWFVYERAIEQGVGQAVTF